LLRRVLAICRCAPIAVSLLASAVTGGAAAEAAIQQVEVCGEIANPYPGTRYEGVALSGIRAEGVSCRTARRVARRAHYKALGLPLPSGGVRHFKWHRWRVKGDLRPSSDVYVANLDGKQVRWRF